MGDVDAAPLPGGEEEEDAMDLDLDEAPAPAPEEEPEQAADVTIADVISSYRKTVVLTLDALTADLAELDERIKTTEDRVERLLPRLTPEASAFERDVLRRDVTLSHHAVTALMRQLRLQIEECHLNMRVLVTNEIFNHCARGPQTAPFRVTEALEATAIGYNIENPAMPGTGGGGPAVIQKRLQLVAS